MSVFKIRERLAVGGSLTLGGDVVISRSAANVARLAAGDILDLSVGNGLRVPNGTAAAGTSLPAGNGGIRLATQGGTPAMVFQLNGTTYYALGVAVP